MLTMHLDNLCNENQIDAPFILNLFRPTTFACFGRIYEFIMSSILTQPAASHLNV
jgi:hypothetical protein